MWLGRHTPLTWISRPLSSSSRPVRVRFAPSPTGFLHLGGFRTALYNYLFAKARGGTFILRIEDTDQSRLVPGAAEALEADLGWTGLPPDESPLRGGARGPYRQSERLDLYRTHVDQLVEAGQAYRCFCTEKRLELLRKEAARSRAPNRYDGKCAQLTAGEIAEKLERGTSYTVRFKLRPFTETFHDLVYGPVAHDVFQFEGDPIVLKSDGFPTYHLANVVDDHLMEISHVLRGVEWQISTPKHILLYRAFGWEPPEFAHLPLIMNSDGTKLSKRQNDLHLSALRERGIFAPALLNFVTLVGGGFQDKEYSLGHLYSLSELTERFQLDRVHTASCRIELDRLDALNQVALQAALSSAAGRHQLIQTVRNLLLEKDGHREGDQQQQLLLNEEQVERVLLWAQNRITSVHQLASKEYEYLWRPPQGRLVGSLTCLTAEQLAQIRDMVQALKSMAEFASLMKQWCEGSGCRYPQAMKDLRLVLAGRAEGPPVTEMLHILEQEEAVRRINNYLQSSENKT